MKRIPTPASPADPVVAAEPVTPVAAPAAEPLAAEPAVAEPVVAETPAAEEPVVEPAPANETDEQAEDGEPVELVEVRVTLAFEGHEPNDVVEVSVAKLSELKAAGHVDDHPEAVEYARSLQA